jgi:UDP-N-acetylglucosamine 2-epimerase (non-hydrolysing)
MPEEINRLVTDAVADLLFVSEPAGVEHLRREGHPAEHIHLVGNVMIDTLLALLPQARKQNTLQQLSLEPGRYGVVTLHRPSNVDSADHLAGLLDVLVETSEELPIVFPIHPRTKQRLEQFGLAAKLDAASHIRQLPPASYLDFLALTSQAKVIVTDSGGLQEESTALGIPCLTTRWNTERPITVDEGTSTLVGDDSQKLRRCLRSVLTGTYRQGRCPELWDGHAAERIARVLVEAGA